MSMDHYGPVWGPKGEQGMSERLTKAVVFDFVNPSRGPAYEAQAENLWSRIEHDREAVRAETREEVRKDHFKIGEAVEFKVLSTSPNYYPATVCLDDGGQNLPIGCVITSVRRPAKKRQRTREEKIKKLKEHFANQYAWLPNELKDGTIDDLCQAFEIPTEVDE